MEADNCNENSDTSLVAYTLTEIMERMNWDGIDLLKVDIEGAELEIFLKNSADWIRRTRIIFVELHEQYAPGCGQALFSALDVLNYSVFLSGENIVAIFTMAISELYDDRTYPSY